MADSRIVTTPVARLSFPNLQTARADMDTSKPPRFSCDLLFDKDADISSLRKAAQAAAEAKWGDKIPKNLKSPFKDGDDKDREEYAGMIYISPWSTQRPGLAVGRNKELVPLEQIGEVFYGGCYVAASISAWAYDNSGNQGVSFGLNHVLKVREGDPFSGRPTTEQAFADVDAEAFGEEAPSWL